jgi:hypothetical protein
MVKLLHPTVGQSSVRDFLYDKGIDIMYYMTERYRNFILRETVKNLNKLYQEVLEMYPSFSGDISILGHSLGGVIGFHLLSLQTQDDPVLLKGENLKLDFKPKLLVLAGSPLGVFLNFDHNLLEQMNKPHPFSLFNVFHPYDPIGYRCEPLLVPPHLLQPPLIVPHYRSLPQQVSAKIDGY